MAKPNIVFFFADQQRFDTIGCYGQELQVTPVLDELAKDGVVMDYAFTPQPVCGPARACLQTGLYASETGCFRNNIALPKGIKTLPMYLKESGYELGYVGKWHLASDGQHEGSRREGYDFHNSAIPLEHRGGWDGFYRTSDLLEFTSHGYDGYVFDEHNNRLDFTGYRVDCITDYGLEFLDSQSKNKPFCLFISHIEPHHQNDHGHYEGPIGSREKFKDFSVPKDLEGLSGDYLEEYPDYLGCCNSLDKNLGRLIDKLKDKGLYDNTVIIYTSDHGSHFRTRNKNLTPGNYDDYKRSCHDSCTHIPMIFRGPGFEGGKRHDGLVSLLDLPKTMLGIADHPEKDKLRGLDLKKVIESGVNSRKAVYIEISESCVGRALRTKKWKYCLVAKGAHGGEKAYADKYEEAYLYDLEKDPYEKNNLAGKGKDTRKLLEMMFEFMKEVGEING